MNLYHESELKQLLARHNFHFSKSKGQNFLIQSWVPEQIISRSNINRDHGVLEIGPGVGALTLEISKVAGKVVAVELDKALLPILEETVGGCENVQIICGNILKTDIPELVSKYFTGLTPIVCANLPYNITSPILALAINASCFAQITVMVQKEVAQRICAQAGSSEYGAFSIFCQYHTEPEILFDVPSSCFVPRPKVTSAVIKLTARREPPAQIDNEEVFFRVVKAAFAQRRKTLANGLFAAFGNLLDKKQLTAMIKQCGYDENIRGETLDIEGFSRIANEINIIIPKDPPAHEEQ